VNVKTVRSMLLARTNPLIAVVDDDQSVVRMLHRALSTEGLDVQSFGSAEEFLDAGSTDYACLILDVDLPGMSGVKLHKNLIDTETDIPVIFVSGECDEATRRQVLKDGAAGFFRKPFSIEPLLAAVRSVACLTPT
jgi:FixJ family two-component response regulator